VHVVRNNLPQYVILSEKDYENMLGDLAESRINEAENDLKAGRVKRGNATKLMNELTKDR
jgi:PHD/YefM family antitoxin component YafN of YafNO toxin-antitoxin module